MEAADCLSQAQLEQLRAEKIQHFIKYCHAHVPYIKRRMKEAGVDPAQIQKPDDLAKLPIMTRADVQNHRESLRSDRAGRLASFSTSGSSGTPLVVDVSKPRIASHVACRQRVSRWWGMSVGDPEIALWGPPLVRTYRDPLRALRDRLFATRLLSAYEMTEATMSGYLDILESGHWRQIFGYPSAVYLLCLHARNQGRSLRRAGIKVAFVTGEVLFTHQRELITETLCCPVANGYGGRDSGFIAHECPQGGMHIMADSVIVEIVDSLGRPMPPGEAGEIVVTDLYSQEAPFLRYATGDIGAYSTRLCTCGRALPLLERLEGRAIDFIMAPDGRVIPGLALNPVLWKVEGIEQIRICQKATDDFHLQIVRSGRFRDACEDQIRKGFAEVLRCPLHMTFEYLPDLPKERSGKFRFIISEVSSGRPLPVNRETSTSIGSY
jgi:phenylacetate-CoA ligase